ncbi:NAD-P-binding protein [Trametes elegans]|nr:NAD-P-binding protein [Trametes elegans]
MALQQYIWLITGASRGIGLELTKQLLASPSNVVLAACRAPSKATALTAVVESAKDRAHIIPLDVEDIQSVNDAVKQVTTAIGSKGIDYLINNAGISVDTAFTMKPDVMEHIFKVNVVGPTLVAQAFRAFVEKSAKKTIVNMSSTMGSLGSETGSMAPSYSISKSALNMLTYKQSRECPDLTVISVCPGHLKTDLGGPTARLDVSVGVAGVLKVIHSLTPEDTGKFVNFRGDVVPW